MSNDTTVGYTRAHLGQTVDFAFLATNTSGHRLTMEPLTFPRGVPPGVTVTHQAVERDHAMDALGWPPRFDGKGPRLNVQPLVGYSVRPGKTAFVMIGVVAQRPGVYLLGPVTFHVEVHGVPVFPAGVVPAEITQPQHAIACVAVSRRACNEAQNRADVR